MTETALLEIQKERGATIPEEQSAAPVALHFGDPAAEYDAAKNRAAVFELSDRTQVELRGGDRVKFLNNLCTNAVPQLQPGSGCEAFVTNVKGRILAHIIVFAAEDALWVETGPELEESLLAHFDKYLITEDVELHGRTAEFGELCVTGPQAAERLQNVGLPVESFGEFGHTLGEVGGPTVAVRRVDLLGAPGFLISVSREALAGVWQALIDAEIAPAGAAAWQPLRIEAGLPVYGVDIDDGNLAQEASRTQRAISFTKGCYLGQEPIARLDALGHVNKELCGLRLDAQPVPEVGSRIVAPDAEKELGKVSSAAFSYGAGVPVALAIIRASHSQEGATVRVGSGESTVNATVFRPQQ